MTMNYDPYPHETFSFDALPDDCPVKYLDYGLFTEAIQDKVILKRREIRNTKTDSLVDKVHMRHLTECLYELDRLGRLDPSNAIIDLNKKKSLVSSKKKIKLFLHQNVVPQIYLEEALEKQIRGHTQFEIGDRVKYKRRDNIFVYSIISGIIDGRSTKQYRLDYAHHRSYLNDNEKYEFYPDYTRITPTDKLICGWDLEFIGKDNEATKRLRDKMAEERDKYRIKLDEIWSKLEIHLLQRYKDHMYNVPRLVNERETIITNTRLRLYPIPPNENLEGLSDDELFQKGVMALIEAQIIPRCKALWYDLGRRPTHLLNVLDKEVWRNVNDKNNVLYILAGETTICGRWCDIQAISTTIMEFNLLD